MLKIRRTVARRKAKEAPKLRCIWNVVRVGSPFWKSLRASKTKRQRENNLSAFALYPLVVVSPSHLAGKRDGWWGLRTRQVISRYC